MRVGAVWTHVAVAYEDACSVLQFVARVALDLAGIWVVIVACCGEDAVCYARAWGGCVAAGVTGIS